MIVTVGSSTRRPPLDTTGAILDPSNRIRGLSNSLAMEGPLHGCHLLVRLTFPPPRESRTQKQTTTGTQISVIGIISDRGVGGPNPSSTYSIDGGTPRVYNGAMGDSVQNQVTFFNSGVLSPGQHEIVVTSLIENSWYWLDHFLVVRTFPHLYNLPKRQRRV